MQVPYCSDHHSFIGYLGIWERDTPNLVLLSQDGLGYLGSFMGPYRFKILCSSSLRNAVGTLIRIALNLQIALNGVDILATLIFPLLDLDMLTLVCVVLHLFHQNSVLLGYWYFTSWVKCFLGAFFHVGATINGMVFLVSLLFC